MKIQVISTRIAILVTGLLAKEAYALDMEEVWRAGEDGHVNENNLLMDAAAHSRMLHERRLSEPDMLFSASDESEPLARSENGKLVVDESTRDYLNGLVIKTMEASDEQKTNIAFVKTHKTASTTFAAILYRYGLRHGSKLAWFSGHGSAIPLEEAARRTASEGRVDIMHYHISVFGSLSESWGSAVKHYANIMRDPDSINYVTIVREPRSHLLSYYYYFMEPSTQKSIEDFLMRPGAGSKSALERLHNPLSAEFGVRDARGLETMIQDFLPKFKMVILVERFDEGLMILRRLLGWDLLDMTYLSLLKTKSGSKRYDGKKLHDVPAFSDLPREVQDRIDDLTQLDQKLYAAAIEEYTKIYEKISREVEEDLVRFQDLQALVTGYLRFNASSTAYYMYRHVDPYSKKLTAQLF